MVTALISVPLRLRRSVRPGTEAEPGRARTA
jgi:hypothetical protein